MSPFSHLLRSLREKRNLRQKDAAELLGYEQSYLSGLENGSRGKPQQEFINHVIKAYELSDEETESLIDSLARSERRYVVPLSASSDEYSLMYLFNHQLGSLTETQISLMKIALHLKECAIEHQ